MQLLQESSMTGESGLRFSCLTRLVASLLASTICAKPSWMRRLTSSSSFDTETLAWDNFCFSSTLAGRQSLCQLLCVLALPVGQPLRGLSLLEHKAETLLGLLQLLADLLVGQFLGL